MAKRPSPHRHDNDNDKPKKAGTSARGSWSGSISFGLLQIPVTLYPAESRIEELHFRMLDKNDRSPIRMDRVNANTGKPVEWKDIVKGYEIERSSQSLDSRARLSSEVQAAHTEEERDSRSEAA